jgi:serine/threonine-protein kinase
VPFPGNTPGTLYAHEHKPVPEPRSLRPDLTPAVEAALIKLLAKAPQERFASSCAFVEQLRQAESAARQAQERETRLAPLYEQLQAAAAQEEWAEVLALGGQIRALDPGYENVMGLMAHARRRLERPYTSPGQEEISRSLPKWAWGAGLGFMAVLVVFIIGGWALGLFSDGRTNAESLDASEPTDSLSLSTEIPSGATPALDRVCDDVGCIGDEKTRSRDGMEMVYVPGGTFQMGSSDEQVDDAMRLCEEYREDCQRSWFEDEQPVHTVTLDSFWSDRTEVTNAQYRQCMEDGNCDQPGCWDDADYNAPQQPVVCVSWEDARAYCEWAGGRLPTEAEWEYTARGPEGFVFPWGDAFDGTRLNFCDENCTYEWKATDYDDGYEKTAPVGSFEAGASWCGALDLAGNVWEWVQDWYGAYPDGPQTNPTGPETGHSRVLRVLRGGSWHNVPYRTRSADRFGYIPDLRDGSHGFRCVLGSTSSPSD